MLLFKTKVKRLPLGEKGLFSEEAIPKKSVVFIFPLAKNVAALSEKEFNKS
jgi:hypothetical protein